jgi:hypothetical protein
LPFSIYTIFDPFIITTFATIVIAVLAMQHRRKTRAQRRASREFTGPSEPLPEPADSRPRAPFLTPLYKRLLISLGLIVVTAFVCWKLLPLAHIDIPWWVPILAFIAILAAALGTARDEDKHDPEGPFQLPSSGDASAPDDRS